MKKLFYLLSLLLATVLANAAELNVYASGLKIMGMTDDRQLSISYFLNAPADEVEFQLLNGVTKEVERTIALSGKAKGVNTAVIDLSDEVDAHYTWAIKAKSNTVNTAITYVAGGNDTERNERFNFYTPAGLAVDNNPNSPYFGRIYVTEARNAITASGRETQQGVHIFGADLSDVTGQGLEPYAGGVKWNERIDATSSEVLHAAYGPARITIDDEGYVYICDNGPIEDGTSGVWRMNPADPSAPFKDVLYPTLRDTVSLYSRINSAIVIGSGRDKKLIAIDNIAVGDDAPNHTKLVRIPLDVDIVARKKVQIDTLSLLDKDGNIANFRAYLQRPHNTIVRGVYNDYWIFQYQNGNNALPIVIHINDKWKIDYTLNLQYCRRGSGAISPDGKWLAFNGVYDGNRIRLFEITYDENNNYKPTLIESNLKIQNSGTYVDGVSFDVAGNLYFAGATNEWFYAHALPKAENTHTTIAPENQQIRIATPRIMAYNLRMERRENKYRFSFYANSNATEAKLLFYEMDNDDDDSNDVFAGELSIAGVVKGRNQFEFLTHEIPAAKDNFTELRWAVQLKGKKNTCFGEVYHSDKVLSRAHAVIDNSPESDFFGRIYVGNRIGVGNGEVYVMNYDYSSILAGGLCGMTQLNSAARPAVDAEGYIYWADFGDKHSGLWVTDPYTLTSTESFFEGTSDDKTGVWKNKSDVVMGGSSCGAHIYGTGKNTKLYLLNEDGTPGSAAANTEYLVYQLGQEDGTIIRKWNTAPTKKVDILDDDGANFSIVGTSRGAWVCQNRTLNYNLKDSYSLQFYDNNGVRQYCSDEKAIIINGSFGGGMAVSADENQLAMVNGNGNILLFDVAWQGEDPALTLRETYPTNFAAISTMHFDYAGNLVVAGGCFGYANNGMFNDLRVVVFSLPTDNNTVIVPAQKKQTLHRAISLLDTEDNTALLERFKDKYENVYVLRSLRAGMYNTLCLPFYIPSLEGTALAKDEADVYAYTEADVTTVGSSREIILGFSYVDGMTAGVPYLVEPEADIDRMEFEFRNVHIAATEPTEGVTYEGITFRGILKPVQLTEGVKSILFLVSNNQLAWANTTASMYGMRGYFNVPEEDLQALRARASIVPSQSTTTDVEEVLSSGDEVQKVLNNGALYIVRDGQVYTILGANVK